MKQPSATHPFLPPPEPQIQEDNFGPWNYDDRRNAVFDEFRQYPPAKLQSEIARYSTMLLEAESREHIARHRWESITIPVEKLEAEHKLEETIALKLDLAERLGLLKEAAASHPVPQPTEKKIIRKSDFLRALDNGVRELGSDCSDEQLIQWMFKNFQGDYPDYFLNKPEVIVTWRTDTKAHRRFEQDASKARNGR